MPLVMQVLFFGALLSAIKSCASATMLAPSVTFVENIWHQLFPKQSDKAELRVMRITVLVFSLCVLAYALAFGAAVLWPVYSVLSRLHGGGFNAVGLFVLLTAVALWAQWLVVDEAPMRWSWSVALQVLAIGAATALGYSCWEHGIQRGNLAVMAAGSYFTPVLSSLWGSVWLAVQPGWPFWQGVALVTVGSLVCWWATRGR